MTAAQLDLGLDLERWAPIAVDDRYSVSTHGRVRRNCTGRILRPRAVGRGYHAVWIRRRNHYLHRLVAEAFIPNPDGLPQINHRDGVKTANHVNNLEWSTASANMAHAWATGLRLPATAGDRAVA